MGEEKGGTPLVVVVERVISPGLDVGLTALGDTLLEAIPVGNIKFGEIPDVEVDDEEDEAAPPPLVLLATAIGLGACVCCGGDGSEGGGDRDE